MREGGKEYIPGIQTGPDTEVGMLGEVAPSERMSFEKWKEKFGHNAQEYAQALIRSRYEKVTTFLRQHQPEDDRGFAEKTDFIRDLQPYLQGKLVDEYGEYIKLEFLTAVHSRIDYMGADAVFTLSFMKGDEVQTHHLLWGVTISPEKHDPKNRDKSALPAHIDFLVPPDGWIRPDKRDSDYERNQKNYKQALDVMSELMFNRFQDIVSHSGDYMDVFTHRRDVREDAVWNLYSPQGEKI